MKELNIVDDYATEKKGLRYKSVWHMVRRPAGLCCPDNATNCKKEQGQREVRATRGRTKPSRKMESERVRWFRFAPCKNFSSEMQTILTYNRRTVESASVKPSRLLSINITTRLRCVRAYVRTMHRAAAVRYLTPIMSQ